MCCVIHVAKSVSTSNQTIKDPQSRRDNLVRLTEIITTYFILHNITVLLRPVASLAYGRDTPVSRGDQALIRESTESAGKRANNANSAIIAPNPARQSRLSSLEPSRRAVE